LYAYSQSKIPWSQRVQNSGNTTNTNTPNIPTPNTAPKTNLPHPLSPLTTPGVPN
jgi:hypothetical protein